MDNTQDANDRLWTVRDVASFLQVKPFTVRAMVREGRLPAISDGKRLIRFDRHEITQTWVNRHRRRAR